MYIDFSNLPPSQSVTDSEKAKSQKQSTRKKVKKVTSPEITEYMKSNSENNPFVSKTNESHYGEFTVPCRKLTDKKGEFLGYSEERLYTRFYRTAANLRIIGAFSPKAKALYLWTMHSIVPYQGFVFLNYKRISSMMKGLSANSLSDAIIELTEAKVILHHEGGYYWVNPRFFYCGNRAYGYPLKQKIRSIKERPDTGIDEIDNGLF